MIKEERNVIIFSKTKQDNDFKNLQWVLSARETAKYIDKIEFKLVHVYHGVILCTDTILLFATENIYGIEDGSYHVLKSDNKEIILSRHEGQLNLPTFSNILDKQPPQIYTGLASKHVSTEIVHQYYKKYSFDAEATCIFNTEYMSKAMLIFNNVIVYADDNFDNPIVIKDGFNQAYIMRIFKKGESI